jgi:lactoylglutathione lyase
VSTVDRQNNDVADERLATSGLGLRLELFVEDMGESVRFYRRALGFEVVREVRGDYASLRSGDIMLGIGPIAKLPDTGGYFTRSIASQRRGLGVEIVMEVDDLSAAHRRVLDSGHTVFEPPSKGHGACGTSESSTLMATICASPPEHRRLENSLGA